VLSGGGYVTTHFISFLLGAGMTATATTAALPTAIGYAIKPQDKYYEDVRSLSCMFPAMPPHDIVNFMEHYEDRQVAQAKIEACLEWRRQNLPIKPQDVLKPLQQGLWYFHGQDREGKHMIMIREASIGM